MRELQISPWPIAPSNFSPLCLVIPVRLLSSSFLCGSFTLKDLVWFDQIWIQKYIIQANDYEIVVEFFNISHDLKWHSAIVHKFTKIYPVCSSQFWIRVFIMLWFMKFEKNCLPFHQISWIEKTIKPHDFKTEMPLRKL